MEMIGIFGGSFDPVHSAHISLLEQLQGILQFDQIQIVPCGRHALDKQFAICDADRIEMLRLAIDDRRFLRLNLLEVESQNISYSVDTWIRRKFTNLTKWNKTGL